MQRSSILVAVLAFAACSDDGGESANGGGGGNGANGGAPADACGPVVESVGTECTTFADCSGRPNQPNVVEARCDNCVPFAQVNVCEAGRCRRIDVDNQIFVQANVEGNFLTEGATGYVEIQMTPVTADGRRVTCAELLTTCDWRTPTLNIFNSNGGIARYALNQQTEIFGDTIEADDLIFMVLVTENGGGRGDIRTIGCADGFGTTFGETTIIPEAIVPLTEFPQRTDQQPGIDPRAPFSCRNPKPSFRRLRFQDTTSRKTRWAWPPGAR
jgi:hypothetical protein